MENTPVRTPFPSNESRIDWIWSSKALVFIPCLKNSMKGSSFCMARHIGGHTGQDAIRTESNPARSADTSLGVRLTGIFLLLAPTESWRPEPLPQGQPRQLYRLVTVQM